MAKAKKKVTKKRVRKAAAPELPTTFEINDDVLRALFAASAAGGMCANPELTNASADQISEYAFDVADAMVDQWDSYEETDEDEEDEEDEEEEEEEDDDD